MKTGLNYKVTNILVWYAFDKRVYLSLDTCSVGPTSASSDHGRQGASRHYPALRRSDLSDTYKIKTGFLQHSMKFNVVLIIYVENKA